ncbi:hypothetical protein BT96DRAFT_979553 [Gymnopus androsaceus JB14]|uniref:Uncharacterized protein n=1 Tax=Gymnopus androsaceus JB14 TaxID=1447944 RepID=A0A6A4H300_9AGAR|nr:hypothetical protein BT96DRAFT_979553 [Gymnopus androsaceus JB14]
MTSDIYAPCPPLKMCFQPSDFKGCPTGQTLPAEFQVDVTRLRDPTYCKPRQIFYGFGLNIQDFIDYHQKYQLPPPLPTETRSGRWTRMMDQVLEDLCNACDFDLRLVLPVSVEYCCMFSLYDSHTIAAKKLEDNEEQEVIQIIRERLVSVLTSQNARWFYSYIEK